ACGSNAPAALRGAAPPARGTRLGHRRGRVRAGPPTSATSHLLSYRHRRRPELVAGGATSSATRAVSVLVCMQTVTEGSDMPSTITNSTVLVTGANRGIGRALVDEALRRGARRVYAGTRQPLAHV